MGNLQTLRSRNRVKIAIAAVLAAVLGAAIYLHSLGYPYGPVYKLIPASAPPSASIRGTVVVFMSGDMGFNTGMGPKIAARIADQGIPVLGLNSLTAFAQRKTPREAAALLREAVKTALALPGTTRVVLVGQSFGANILLSALHDLPAALRARVPLVGLIVPGETTAFHTMPGGVFNIGDSRPALPAAQRLDWVPVLCIHGQTEPDSLCSLWTQRNVARIALPGDHFLREDTTLVANTLMREIHAVTAPSGDRLTKNSGAA